MNSKEQNLKERLQTEFDKYEQQLNGEKNSRIHAMRRDANAKSKLLPFPTTKTEDWKYTDISSLLGIDFQMPPENPEKVKAEAVRPFLLNKTGYINLVFIDGVYQPEFSSEPDKTGNMIVMPMEQAVKEKPDLIERYLNTACGQENLFNALNTSFLNHGTFIYIPDNFTAEVPVYLLNLSGVTDNTTSFTRNLIIAGRNSESVIIENYGSLSSGTHFTNPVTEIFLEQDARVKHIRIQDENQEAFHISSTDVLQKTKSAYTNYNLSFGSKITRNDINVRYLEPDAESHLYGLYIAGKGQHVDNHTMIDHAKPQCRSNELYKGVLSGDARGVFNGKVIVREQAQKTNAYQQNKNILLSDEASIDTKPQLEIFADDVKCSHGATVGRLDEQAMFYLRARGFGKELARSILIFAFADDTIRAINDAPLVKYLEQKLNNKLNSEF